VAGLLLYVVPHSSGKITAFATESNPVPGVAGIARRTIQLCRNNTLNGRLAHQQIEDVCALYKADQLLLQRAIETR